MITVVGSNTVDYFSYSERLPLPGETLFGNEMMISAGGKGANQAAAAAKLGAQAFYLGMVGELDRYVDLILDGLKRAGVDVSNVETAEGSYCGAGYVMINTKTAQNCIIIIYGANSSVTPEYIERHKEFILKAKICMTEYMIPIESAQYAMELARKNGVMTVVNPAPAAPTSDAFYKCIDLFLPNEVEAMGLTGIEILDEKAAAETAAFFHGKGVKQVVITLGGRGAFVSDGQRSEIVPSYRVKAVDTSGAGDAFNGAIAYALLHGKDLFEAARFANAAAAVSVTRKGTMASLPTLAEVLRQMNEKTFTVE